MSPLENRSTKTRSRSKKGSVIAEFGPALFIFVMVIFFPFLNMVGMAISYADCLYLDTLLLRQAALEPVLVLDNTGALTPDLTCSTDPNGVLNTLIKNWLQAGLGQFASTGSMPKQTCYIDLSEGTAKNKFIHLNLTVECRPFLQIPFFIQVPGINQPFTFKYSGRSLIENIPS